MELSRALMYAYDGLYYLSIACETLGLIKPLPYSENEEQVYHARFKYIKNIPVPSFVPYENFVEVRDTDRNKENSAVENLEMAKQYFMVSKNHLGKMMAMPENMRNT
jgi:hypothetical protein